MFLGIGHDSQRRMFRGLIDLDDDGYIRTTDQVFTRFPGSLPAAMCRTAGTARPSPRPAPGCMAALEVEKYLEEHGH
jgi:thioredoxin reductase (NADPH)